MVLLVLDCNPHMGILSNQLIKSKHTVQASGQSPQQASEHYREYEICKFMYVTIY